MRIATFNVQNMRLRRPDGQPRLDGARDGDMPEDSTGAAAALDPIDRALTARVLAEADADAVALQEVFDQRTLDYFHDAVLLPVGADGAVASLGDDVGHGQVGAEAVPGLGFDCGVAAGQFGVQPG